jgi:hypothetical protein
MTARASSRTLFSIELLSKPLEQFDLVGREALRATRVSTGSIVCDSPLTLIDLDQGWFSGSSMHLSHQPRTRDDVTWAHGALDRRHENVIPIVRVVAASVIGPLRRIGLCAWQLVTKQRDADAALHVALEGARVASDVLAINADVLPVSFVEAYIPTSVITYLPAKLVSHSTHQVIVGLE